MQKLIIAAMTGVSVGMRKGNRASKSNAQIVCPVIAALHRAGDLNTDSDGNMEIQDLYNGLHGKLLIGNSLAWFQSYGIVGYNSSQKNIEESRNSCKPPGSCYLKRRIGGTINDSTMRYLNIYKFNGKQTTEHGISTGVRGGDTNMPPDAVNCNGVYPCVERFNQFFKGVAANDKFYLDDIKKVICKARKIGDRGGEHAYAESNTLLGWDMGPVPGREWQMRGAMSATLFAFGRTDSQGELYLTLDDWKALMLEGRYPDDFQPREHGCLLTGCSMSAYQRFNLDIPCDVDYDEPFWQGTGCNVYTEKTCGLFSSCPSGSTCIGRKCLCNRGSNYKTMCFKNGQCQEQSSSSYSFLGSPHKVYPADNPSPRGNA